MISLCGLARSFPGERARPHVVFRPTDLDIPTDRCVAILGGRGQGKTVLLELLAGRLRPESGSVVRSPGLTPVDLSPVINAGRFLHPGLTGTENLRFIARVHGVDTERLMCAVDAFCGLGAALAERVRALEGGVRRVLEAAIALMLPFDCYLLDDAQQLPPAVLERCLQAARGRGAGMIFAATAPRPRPRANLAPDCTPDCTIVIADATLRRFDDAAAAARFLGEAA